MGWKMVCGLCEQVHSEHATYGAAVMQMAREVQAGELRGLPAELLQLLQVVPHTWEWNGTAWADPAQPVHDIATAALWEGEYE
jgi:hypothetical protein